MSPRPWRNLLLNADNYMVNGIFAGNVPFVKIAVAWGQSVQTPLVVLDTGFTGDLQVTLKNGERTRSSSFGRDKGANCQWANC